VQVQAAGLPGGFHRARQRRDACYLWTYALCMDISAGSTAGSVPGYGGCVRISDDEWVKDERTGEMRLSEKGITRQKEDVLGLAGKLGVRITRWYEENDTTAFKKKRIRLPNGRSVWRVIRPEFRRMLADYEDGQIAGVIFYDLDRLARNPRDLEDQIDLAEYYKRPVETVTGQLDLRTSNGRTMARVLVAMATKSSEDTSRRVARAQLQQAQSGQARRKGGHRPFGYRPDRTLDPNEAQLLRDGAARFLAGETWSGIARYFEASGIRPVAARNWNMTVVRQLLTSPSVAGIVVYNGAFRKENQEGVRRSAYTDPEGVALRDASGQYVRSEWPPILAAEQWTAVVTEWKRRTAGQVFSAAGTRKYLLSGLLRCGRVLDDGGVCNASLVGAPRKYASGRVTLVYKCKDRTHGGCGGIERNAGRLDALIEELLFRHITGNAPDDAALPAGDDDDPDVPALAEIQRRLLRLRTDYAEGNATDDTFFGTVPALEARERKLRADMARKARVRSGRLARNRSPEDVRREWGAGDVAVRRAILSRYFRAIVIRRSAPHGPAGFDYASIVPVWKDSGAADPGTGAE
jgi:site-specific DNA recombinase